MEHTDHSSPACAPTGAPVPALSPDQERAVVLDAHGYDPDDYDWIPVRRQSRPDGWSAEKQRLFIATLADTGSVTQAARAVGKSPKSAYELRRAPDGAGFDRAWVAAVRQGMNRLVDECLERAMNGTEVAVYDKEGRVIGMRTRHHDRMAMFLLRAHMPDLFRDAHKADRAKGEALPPRPEPVAEALKAIDPVAPTAPHALLSPDELDTALEVANIVPGQLPRWRRDRDLADMAAAEAGPLHAGLGEQFERDLEAAKNGTWKPPVNRKARRAAKRR